MQAIRGNEISMVFQEPMTSLNPVFTVGRQIAESFRFHQNMGKAQAHEKAVDMLRDKIEHGTQGYVHQILLPGLVKRGTCRTLD